MDWLVSTAVAVVSAVSAILVSWGIMTQRVKDLERRHDELAKEARENITKTSTMDTRLAVADSKLVHVEEQLTDKASADAVKSVKEAIARLEDKLDLLLRALVKDGGPRPGGP